MILALLIGILAGHFWGKKSGFILGGVTFSHWLLDFLVHRQDLPILPGNYGNLKLVGLGLWNFPVVSILLEAALIFIGAFMFFRSMTVKSKYSNKNLNIATASIMALLLILSLVTDVIGV